MSGWLNELKQSVPPMSGTRVRAARTLSSDASSWKLEIRPRRLASTPAAWPSEPVFLTVPVGGLLLS